MGFALLGLSIVNLLSWVPKIGVWSLEVPSSIGIPNPPYFVALALLLLLISSIPIIIMRDDLRSFALGFSLIFTLSFLAILIAQQSNIKYWGLEYVLWALLLGVFVSNVIELPKQIRSSIRTELFIKIGLVLLGAEILFNTLLSAGVSGLFEITVGLFTVWYFCYYLAIKLGLGKSFACTMASATSICGVSAAIAAGGAVKGDPKEVSHTVSLVLLFSIPLLVLMPFTAKIIGLPDAVAGAWIGGTIDTTPAVAAAGSLYSDKAMKVASIIKMSQNVLIGIMAFMLAVYWTLRVERSPGEKPKPIEIWYRFPKFILGFIAASALSSFLLVPILGSTATDAIISQVKNTRSWYFAMAFVCIGLSTDFKDLFKIGRGRPLLVFTASILLDMAVSLLSAYVFFGGILFPPPV